VIETDEFRIPLPEGYRDGTAAAQKYGPDIRAVFTGNTRMGWDPSILVQKEQTLGGSFADPALCVQTGNHRLKIGGGVGVQLESAKIMDGPVGKTCQVHLVASELDALITELNKSGNTPATPREAWIMGCTYAHGDTISEATCRSTLAGFRFKR
jgi:hypothetical protein